MLSKLMNQFSSVGRKIIEEGAKRDEEEIQKLTRDFRAIRYVLEDEENQKQLKENAVEDLLIDIDDSLDELMIKSMTRKVRTSLPFYLFSCRRLVLRRDVALKLKKIDAIAVKGDGIHREIKLAPAMISVVDFSEVYGRDEEINRVLNFLLSESSEGPTLPTISIVGVEGIGKTTLARHVFDTDAVKTHFERRIWVSASYPLEEIRVATAILESLKDGASNLVEMETVLKQISKLIQGKKVFLVLDDVWTGYPKYWEQLKYSLKSGSRGSRILLITRELSFGNKMGITERIRLGRLSQEGSWSLFYQLAFFGRNIEEGKKLEETGRKIVGKCNGLPFAIKIIGSLLRLKKSLEDWQNVLDSEIWKLEQVEKEHFLPLLLSYHDLHLTLKKCLSFCAIFPKNYEIEQDRLIKLWMSQGYLRVEGREEMELIGEEYFENLAMRSFFQDFQMNEYDGRIIRCKMHDIVHDFAQILSKNECCIVQVNRKCLLVSSNENIQHLMMMFEGESPFPISVYNRKKLRSLLVESGGGYMTGIALSELFDKLTCLRALDLCNQDNICYKVIKEIPRGVEKMIHLRYLNLSYNSKIKKLPETLCELYNLESIELSWCISLKNLPQRMGQLINMRHLVNDQTSLSYIPRGIERLTCLRTLSELIVSGGSDDGEGCELGCLKNLNHLRGSLKIKRLGNVNKDEINKAELTKKENLVDLCVSFEKDEEKGRKNDDDENALEDLQLPPNLERLEIIYYRGSRISLTRIMSLTKLRLMSLDRCMNLEQLPRLGELPSLESLTIRNMRSLEKVGNEFLGIDQSSGTGKPSVAFPKLKSLEFQKMEAWKEWKCSKRRGENIEIMPCLRSLTIGLCPKLETLPDGYLLQMLDELKIISSPILKERYKEGTAERQKISHINVSFD